MGWIQEHISKSSDKPGTEAGTENQFSASARARWQALGEELRADVDEFNRHGSGAELVTNSEDEYQLRNTSSGLDLTLIADFDNHNIRYSYAAINQQSAGVPEGGMLSMRQSRRGKVEFYSADERLTSEETSQVLLEPLLFPRQNAA
jgi:hypothetical protein